MSTDDNSGDDNSGDDNSASWTVYCPDGVEAECGDGDGSCWDGDDDWYCDDVFFCSNDGESYAAGMGGVLCSISGVDVCEDGLSEASCDSIACCQWDDDDGQCYSDASGGATRDRSRRRASRETTSPRRAPGARCCCFLREV